MSAQLSNRLKNFLQDNLQHHFDITLELGQIPAPSNNEQQRALWVKNYFDSFGGTQSYIDKALNVVLPINCENCNEITVFMAHTDVVFPDTTPLPLNVENGNIYCPGIGDDTANLTTLLLIAKYILTNNINPKKGILIVANSGEEGLGNLKGCKQIMADFKGRIKELISFDGTFGFLCNDAVGSHRYKVTFKTEGGHSFGNFGNRNAIANLSSMITALYNVKVPPLGITTYNVGIIEGGTSVNTIAQQASMLYEYRSDNQSSLSFMEKMFKSMCDTYRNMGIEVDVQLLGDRPCSGDVDKTKLNELTQKACDISEFYTNKPCKISASSTDCNVPLSLGIPAICFGLCEGEGAHTREEYIKINSLPIGAKIAGAFMGQYFNEF